MVAWLFSKGRGGTAARNILHCRLNGTLFSRPLTPHSRPIPVILGLDPRIHAVVLLVMKMWEGCYRDVLST